MPFTRSPCSASNSGEDTWGTEGAYLPQCSKTAAISGSLGQGTVRSSASIAAAQSRSLGRKIFWRVVSGTLVA